MITQNIHERLAEIARNARIATPADQQIQTCFIDPAVTDAFREFHKVALLRAIAADVNGALAAQQQRPHVNRPVVLP
jgi:hypothetical protein